MHLKIFTIGSLFALPLANAFSMSQVKFMFLFGDSYTDTGFNPSGTLPNNANPLGNPAFPGVTSDGGENWVGFLVKTFNKTNTFAFNFAVSGATLDSSLAAPFSPTVTSVRNQIEQVFLPNIGKKPANVPWNAQNSLFVIWDGINDVLNIDGNSNQQSAQQPFFTLYANLVNELVTAGARNFLFMGVPAIDKTPFVMQQGPNNPALAAASLTLWNQNVNTVIKNLKAAHSDVTAFFMDNDALFNNLVANPQSIGLANDSALWFNTLHPVVQVHQAIAQAVSKLLG